MVVMAATIALGLAACGSSDSSGDPTLPVGTSAAVTTEPSTTATGAATVVVTEADVADLEKQLDEVDQLLAGVDADLNQD
jgi:uncharacterized lipoprotein YmbA